jgi:acyl carrier protein
MPTANMKVYVLDPYLNPVPVGIPGELYIGGCGLARGYLDRPELTAEKFIPDPFSTRSSPIGPSQVDRASGERLYRSGDLVRYLPDGNLEFLGRMDNQVKLRGFRIELGEIESLLNQYPGIRQAVANVREDQPGDHRLVVYLVADSGNDIDPSEIREYLKAFLPAYMLPSTYVFMEAFPTTSSGKVDRRALPIPDIVHQPSGASQGAPQTPLEQVLAGIFSQVLGVTSISVHDNFFDMGGHSLLAIRLSSQIGETFDLEIPMRTVFESPTVAEMAEQMLANPENREKVEDTARLLLEIAQLSEAEASKLLDQIKRRPE